MSDSKQPRKLPGGWADTGNLPRGPNGRALCRRCGLEVPKGRRTFCSPECVHDWRLRTDPGYLREQVFQRDRGYCALCFTDTVRVYGWMRRLRGAGLERIRKEWGITSERQSLWDADHIVPVAEGGGACDLGNIRTLCLKCHRQVTAALRMRLAEAALNRKAATSQN